MSRTHIAIHDCTAADLFVSPVRELYVDPTHGAVCVNLSKAQPASLWFSSPAEFAAWYDALGKAGATLLERARAAGGTLVS